MAPGQQSKQELSSKDAMFLLELMRDSPQAILFHIGPYCEKTGTKPNTIVKRLGEIKKRNGLNIITTTSPPNGNTRAYAAPKAPSKSKPKSADDKETKPNIKAELEPQSGKLNATELAMANGFKVEMSDPSSPGVAYGLPSPAESAAGAGKAATPTTNGVPMAHMPLYMPQKRRVDDHEGYGRDVAAAAKGGRMNKKIKTEN
ncbi:hypothetical protein FOPE_01649 [Fonsecaea pedrosoi]|nr:hypothetical protein FOPE_01649 [Fonsecaea pedrosoi]